MLNYVYQHEGVKNMKTIPIKKYLSLVVFAASVGLLTGCSQNTATITEKASVITITAEEAKNMMDQEDSIIIVDVRTQEEYDAGYIEGAVLIPDFDIEAKAESLLPDKDATILIYCRSGRRSALAAQKLVELGYQNIYDFGGIIDWNYDIVLP
jgi:phage shock protein E